MIDFVPTLAAVALPAYVGPVVALVAGILILLKPDLLAKIVAIYLIVVGALGLSHEQHVVHQAMRALYGQVQHCNVDVDSGPLNWVFSTPDLHRWHHSTVYAEGDTNYGAITSVWDQVFGTHFEPADREGPEQIGVGRMPDFPRTFWALERVPLDWKKIRDRNAETWFADEPVVV
jgi:sterol desaturase/sphingolipid hydroxylase (fatty acid hydroxylase superfamily)